MRTSRTWIIASAGLVGAVVIGMIAAWLVFPSDQPKPAASSAAIAIAPRARPSVAAATSPVPAVLPMPVPVPSRTIPPHRAQAPPKPAVAAPDADPATVTTTNSW